MQKFKYKEAAEKYEEILGRVPPSALRSKIYFHLGEIYHLYLGNNEKAIHFFEETISSVSDPNLKILSKERLAKIYFEKREFFLSEKYYRTLYNFFPKLERHEKYQFNLGFIFLKRSKLKKAESIFKKIIKTKNHQFKIKSYFHLGLVEFNSKRWKKAIDYWNHYLKLENKEEELIEAKFLLANTYETMENLEKAYEIYYSILEEYPNQEVIRNRLKSVYKRKIERKR